MNHKVSLSNALVSVFLDGICEAFGAPIDA
jgi:hypothetical protein